MKTSVLVAGVAILCLLAFSKLASAPGTEAYRYIPIAFSVVFTYCVALRIGPERSWKQLAAIGTGTTAFFVLGLNYMYVKWVNGRPCSPAEDIVSWEIGVFCFCWLGFLSPFFIGKLAHAFLQRSRNNPIL